MGENHINFNIDEKFLDKYLFCPEKPKNGTKTYFNTNYIPHFFHFVKSNLSEEENQNLIEYEL